MKAVVRIVIAVVTPVVVNFVVVNMELILEKLTDDKDKLGVIIHALKIKNGYCPCSVIKDDDHKCPCKEYRETNHCHCKLYKK